MNEAAAWLAQAASDNDAAKTLAKEMKEKGRCHAIAKWQQTVEKSVKGGMAALFAAGLIRVNYQPRHDISRYISTLVRLPSKTNNDIQSLLRKLFTGSSLANAPSIRAGKALLTRTCRESRER